MVILFGFPVTSPEKVGKYFVAKYYNVFRKQTHEIRYFYNDSSSIILIDGKTVHSVSESMTMKQLLVSLKISYIEVETVNTLRSWSNGFLVSVYGIFKSVDVHGPRQFVQTFFLAPQMNGYFVQNEIFHFAGSCQSHVPVADERSVNQQPTASSCPPGAQGAEPVIEFSYWSQQPVPAPGHSAANPGSVAPMANLSDLLPYIATQLQEAAVSSAGQPVAEPQSSAQGQFAVPSSSVVQSQERESPTIQLSALFPFSLSESLELQPSSGELVAEPQSSAQGHFAVPSSSVVQSQEIESPTTHLNALLPFSLTQSIELQPSSGELVAEPQSSAQGHFAVPSSSVVQSEERESPTTQLISLLPFSLTESLELQRSSGELVAEPQPSSGEPVAEPQASTEEPVVEPAKSTYASIMPSTGNTSHLLQPHRQQTTPGFPTPQRHVVVNAPSYREDIISETVYVRNLPLNVECSQIHQALKVYGKIKPGRITLKSKPLNGGPPFAFVEFEDVSSAQKAIQEVEKLLVLERATDRNVSDERGLLTPWWFTQHLMTAMV